MIMKLNRLMKVILESTESDKNSFFLEDKRTVEQRIDRLVKDLVYEKGCLFMKTYNGQADPENFSDKTEFEASQNEILINSEFPKKRVAAEFALEFFKLFNEWLAEKYYGKICSVLSEDDGRWTFRFHIVRDNEPMWISGDIEKFSQPVLYTIFGWKEDRHGRLEQ